MGLNIVGADSFLSFHNNPIQLSNHMPMLIIDPGSCEWFLLVTLAHS